MNVLLLPSAFHPHKGGVEEATLQLARQLADRGHGVRVATIRHPQELLREELVEGIEVVRLRYPSPRAAPGPAASFPFRLAGATTALARLRPRPDVVHVQCASAQLAAAVAMSRLRRLPLVVTTQGETAMDANRMFERSGYFRTVFRVGARSAAALTACSAWTARSAARLAPRFAAAEVIPNGVDLSQWKVSPVPEAPVVAAWGRHVTQKGFDLLLDAWPRVRELVPGAELLLGGDGPETRSLQARASAGVTLVGPLDRSGVQRLLDRSRVSVVPSRIEPFGIVALEAMATGRSVVWSSHGGLREATGGLGHGVDPTDADSLAAAVAGALAEPAAPGRYRRHAERFSWEAVTDRYLAVYEAARTSS